MEKVIIFGIGKIAEVVYYFFNQDTRYEVSGFTVDEEFLKQKELFGLPVISSHQVTQVYPPDSFKMFVAIGYQDMNELRSKKLKEVWKMGYQTLTYRGNSSGIPDDLDYGSNCFIMDGCHIHPRVKLGDNVFVWSGSIVGHHSEIGDNCWITSGANIAGNVKTGINCFFAIGATLSHSISIGDYCFIGSNALVTKDLEDNKVMIAESTKPFRLDSQQFLKLSRFSSL